MTEKVWITLIHDLTALIALLGIIGCVVYLFKCMSEGGEK